MGNEAAAAVLDSFCGDPEVSAAFVPQGVKGAVAEQTIKIVWISILMTGEIFTFFMAEKGILFILPNRIIHNDFPPMIMRYLKIKKGAETPIENFMRDDAAPG